MQILVSKRGFTRICIVMQNPLVDRAMQKIMNISVVSFYECEIKPFVDNRSSPFKMVFESKIAFKLSLTQNEEF